MTDGLGAVTARPFADRVPLAREPARLASVGGIDQRRRAPVDYAVESRTLKWLNYNCSKQIKRRQSSSTVVRHPTAASVHPLTDCPRPVRSLAVASGLAGGYMSVAALERVPTGEFRPNLGPLRMVSSGDRGDGRGRCDDGPSVRPSTGLVQR